MKGFAEQNIQKLSESSEEIFSELNAEMQFGTYAHISNQPELNKKCANAEENFARNIRPFKCCFTGCNKDYMNKSRLHIHLRTHTGDKPFMCDKCGRSFNEKGNLKIHDRIHTGEKPYKCTYQGCKKEFKAYGHLSDHLKRHLNIRPFICDICNACFSRRNTLKTHIMTHTGEKPHICSYPGCNKRFSEKGNMKTHLKTHDKNYKIKPTNCESKQTEENQIFFYQENSGFNPKKDLIENFEVQKCYEYYYIGSKTNSSTTVVPFSPKRFKIKEDKNSNNKSFENALFQLNNFTPEEEIQICASPKNFDYAKSYNNIIKTNYINNDNNDKSNTNNLFNINKNSYFFSVKNNKEINMTNLNQNFDRNLINNNNNNNKNLNKINETSKNNLNTNNKYMESLTNMMQKANENAKAKNRIINNNTNPNFNYAKFFEAQKHLQLSSSNSADSSVNNIITASTNDSPLQLNTQGDIDLKQNFYNNLNLIFDGDYYAKNTQRNGEIFYEDDFTMNNQNVGFLSNNFNSEFISFDNFFD